MSSSQQPSELVSQLEPALTLFNGELPKAAIELAVAHQAESTPLLLGYIEYALANLESLDPYYYGHLLALFILSQFKETKAFPLVLAICKLSHEQQETLLEDSLTEDLAKFIASTFDGNLALLKQHIEDTEIGFFARSQLMQSLFVLLNNKNIELTSVESYVNELFDRFIADNDKDGATLLVNFCLDFTVAPYIEKIQHAFELNLVDADFITPSDVEHVLNAKEAPAYLNARFYQMITNTVDEILWWHCFQANNADHDHHDGCCSHDHGHDHNHAHEHEHHAHDHHHHHHHHHDGCCGPKTIQYSEPKIGRNDPCSCGSGKKFKKCCL